MLCKTRSKATCLGLLIWNWTVLTQACQEWAEGAAFHKGWLDWWLLSFNSEKNGSFFPIWRTSRHICNAKTKCITVSLQMGRFFELFVNVTWPGPKFGPTDNCVGKGGGGVCDAVCWYTAECCPVYFCIQMWQSRHDTAAAGMWNNQPTRLLR